MDDKEYIRQLEERIVALENKLNNIRIGTNGNITMTQCSVHNLDTNHDCNIKLEDCSLGTAINCDVDEGEDRIEELEERVEELGGNMEELASNYLYLTRVIG